MWDEVLHDEDLVRYSRRLFILRTIEIFGNRLNLHALDMYAYVEQSPIVEERTDSEFNETHYQNSPNL